MMAVLPFKYAFLGIGALVVRAPIRELDPYTVGKALAYKSRADKKKARLNK
jgi:hypothetical protein